MADPHELAPVPAAPALPGGVVVRPTLDDLLDAACADVFLQAQGCVRAFGDFHLAIEPAQAPLRLAMRLMVDPLYRSLPWERAHVWLTADGPLPPDHDESGFAHVCGLLGEHAGVPAGQMHPAPIGQPRPDEAYEAELRRCLGHREPGHARLDFVVAAVGPEGEVAGVRAGSAALTARSHAVAEDGGGGVRVCLSLATINAARCVGVLASGARARGGVRRVERGEACPAAGLAPMAGELRWYVDHAACGAGGGES